MSQARELRRNPTEPEIRLWWALSNSQLGGFKFRRQHEVGLLVVDFFCPSIGLIVEVDGDTPDRVADATRDLRMIELGYATLRFSNADVMTNIEGVCEAILATARSRPQRWDRSCSPTAPPQPLP